MDIERLERTKVAMESAGLDALLCRLPENVKLLSGHWPLVGISFLLFPLEGTPHLIVPHCDENEAREEVWFDDCISFRYAVLDAGDAYAEIAKALKSVVGKNNWKRIGIETSFEAVAPPWNAAEPAIPASVTRRMLEHVFGDDSLVDATDLLMGLRARKTPDEQALFRIVNEISTFGLKAFKDSVDVGVSGLELVAAVESAVMLEGTGYLGAKRVRAFAQVSTGSDETTIGYRPMEISTTRKLKTGDIALLELAVVADGVWSDRTRPAVAGRPDAKIAEIHAVVKAAQEAAIDAISAGVRCGDVDAAARSIINEAGFSNDAFLHVTGHGLGFRYHEPIPLILPGSDAVLEEGMLHSVEPGVYLPGIGGIRIEDDVIVTDTGAEVLGPYDRRL